METGYHSWACSGNRLSFSLLTSMLSSKQFVGKWHFGGSAEHTQLWRRMGGREQWGGNGSSARRALSSLDHHWLSPAQTAFIQCSLWHMPLVVGSVVIPLPCQSRDKHLGRVGERRTGERNLYNHTWMGLKWLARRGWGWCHNSDKADREAWPTPCDQHLT